MISGQTPKNLYAGTARIYALKVFKRHHVQIISKHYKHKEYIHTM